MIVPIVEGHGELKAIRVLVDRILASEGRFQAIGRPLRVKRYSVVKPDELERAIEMALRTREGVTTLMLVLDADDDCPKSCAPWLIEKGEQLLGGRAAWSVVLANREYEAWFLGGISGLLGDLPEPLEPIPDDVESVRDAKGLLGRALGVRYSETIDQAGFSARFNLAEALVACRSLRKLRKDLLAVA